jgi:hypothetical protein
MCECEREGGVMERMAERRKRGRRIKGWDKNNE